MSLIAIDHNPSPAKLRTFALALPLFFGIGGAIARWRWEQPAVAFAIWGAGATLVLLLLMMPRLRRPVYVAWMCAALPIGVVVSFFALALIYFLILTPVGLVRRMFGDPLTRRFDRNAATYWSPARPRTDKNDYFRQF
jgi:hypothetical protein